jgi:hypothetical protein
MPGEYKGRRGSAQSYIPQLIEEGYSNREIVDWLSENDLSYRNQYMLADINRSRLENQGAWAIKNLDPDAPIPERWMRSWHGETDFAYRVVINYEFFDTRTMTTSTSGTTLYFDHPPSESEVLSYFEQHKESLQALYNNVEEVFHAQRIMYFRNVGQ